MIIAEYTSSLSYRSYVWVFIFFAPHSMFDAYSPTLEGWTFDARCSVFRTSEPFKVPGSPFKVQGFVF